MSKARSLRRRGQPKTVALQASPGLCGYMETRKLDVIARRLRGLLHVHSNSTAFKNACVNV